MTGVLLKNLKIAPTMPSNGHNNAILELTVEWSGPHQLTEVLNNFNRGGSRPLYDGIDYGVYQIYGKHILSGSDILLYIGRAINQTFSSRFYSHQAWLGHEPEIAIYLGRIYDRARHLPADDWAVWVRDAKIAECLLIHKYSPNYNSVSIAEPPSLKPYQQVILNHFGDKHRLQPQDNAPRDW